MRLVLRQWLGLRASNLAILLWVGSIPLLAQTQLRIADLPDLPALNGKPNPGIAGGFAGLSHGALLLAGGANFPDGYPWQGGRKVWQTAVYALVRQGNTYRSVRAGLLNEPRAYGASVVWNEQLICIGGNDDQRSYREVFTLTWIPYSATVQRGTLPALPKPLANLSAAIAGHHLYVCGGESNGEAQQALYVLDLEKPRTGWQRKADLPGSARAFSALVSQSNGRHRSLYMLGGRQTRNGLTTVFNDAYEYQIQTNTWQRLPDLPQPLSAHGAVAWGASAIWVIGGDSGERLSQIEALNNQLTPLPEGNQKQALTRQRNALQADHPGFLHQVWQYNTVARLWSVLDTLPFRVPVTTPVVRWGQSIILPSGETSPGIRTPAIRQLSLRAPK